MKKNSLVQNKPVSDLESENIKLNSIVAQGPYFIEPSSNALYELVIGRDSIGFLHDVFKPQNKPYPVSADDLLKKRLVPVNLEEMKPLFIDAFNKQGKGNSYWGIHSDDFQFFSLRKTLKRDLCFSGAVTTKDNLTKKVLLFNKDQWLEPDLLISNEAAWFSGEKRKTVTNNFKVTPTKISSYIEELAALNAKYAL